MSNCPQCGVGVIEQIGYIEIKQGPIEIVLKPELPDRAIPAITIKLCSRGPCTYMEWGAAPESFTLSKKR
ncbi:hypothetical protein GXP70_15340 [Paenibacillus lycopersici]|uniref:Uncharacterized protein n=1 Tax=Paenibacillus lycopersici TaxID=2704462 RepID=A0A6C0FVN2_9BACL|nr:hypothetical protein [Paenibacillus lycopersici]QHT61196.1 hypothetical protein GXP70_15340 [Paenibacillus lycopersici]